MKTHERDAHEFTTTEEVFAGPHKLETETPPCALHAMPKPIGCPFCGKTDRLYVGSLGAGDDWFVECEGCECGLHAVHATRELAIKAWNRRVPYEGLRTGAVDAITKFIKFSISLRNKNGYRCAGCGGIGLTRDTVNHDGLMCVVASAQLFIAEYKEDK